MVKDVVVFANKKTILDASISQKVALEECVVVGGYKVPLVQQDNTTQGRAITSKGLSSTAKRKKPNLPSQNVSGIKSQPAGVGNGNIVIRGSQSTGAVSSVNSAQIQGNPPPLPPMSKSSLPKSGQLTAGHWNDLENKDYWQEILAEDLNQWKNHWQLFPTEVIELELLNKSNLPLIDAEVNLYTADRKETLWTARTDNKGKAALWVKPFN